MSGRKKHFIFTPVLTVLGRAGGLIIPFLIARWFGAGAGTDAFFLAYTLIVALSGIFTPLFETILLPYLSEHRKDPSQAASLTREIVRKSLPWALGIAVFLGCALPFILKFSSGLDDATGHLVGRFFFEMVPVFLFALLASSSNGIFYTHKIFWFPALSPAIRFVIIVAFLLGFRSALGAHALTLGFGVGEMVRWGIGAYLLSRLALGARGSANSHGVTVRDFFGQASFQILALFALNLTPLTDQWCASWFGTGSLTLMAYADRFFQIPYQFFLTGVLQIFLSYWSDDFFEKTPAEFWKRIHKDIRIVFAISVAVSLGLFFVRQPLSQLFLGSGGNLAPEQIRQVADLFGWLVLGLAPSVVNLLYARVLFILKKNRVFCFQSWLKFFLNIFFNIIGMKLFGIAGIAVSTTLVSVASTLWLYFYLEKQSQNAKAGNA